MQKKQPTYRRLLSITLKALIALTGFFYIFSQWNRQHGEELLNSWWQATQASTLFFLIIFMLFNWGIEAAKWQLLVKPIQRQSFWKALYTVLSGISIAIITPARLGEFAGRIVHLSPQLRFQGFVSSVTGSISQLSVTLLGGISAFPLLVYRYTDFMNQYPAFIFYLLCFICLLSCSLILLFYFGLPIIEKRLLKYKLFKKALHKLDVMKHFNTKTLFVVLLYSLIRYIIFTTQYFLMFKALNLPVELSDFWVLMSTVFLVSSFIPSFSLGEVLTRGSVLVWVFALIQLPAEKLLVISFIIWLVNLALPALVGYIFFMRARIFQNSINS